MNPAARFDTDSRTFDEFDHGFFVADSDRRPVVVNRSARRLLDMPEDDHRRATPLRPWTRLSQPPTGSRALDPLDEVIGGAASCGPELVAIPDAEGLRHVVQVDVRADHGNSRDRLAKATMVKSLQGTRDDQMSPLFTAVFEEAPVAMGLAEVDGTGAASIVRVNSAYTRLLGFSHQELLGRGEDLIHPDDAKSVNDARRGLATGRLGRHVTEARILRADGSYIWGRMSRATVDDEPGRVRYVLAIIEDITEQKQREWELGRRASTDSLTGLLNRAGLEEVLSSLLEVRSDDRVAVALVDLDNFKAVNDLLGHAMGDEVLVGVARGLKAAVRPTDVVARLGGDEFVVVAHVGSKHEADGLSRRIGERVDNEVEGVNELLKGGYGIRCGVSAGVVVALHGETPEEVLERADRAMYRSKRARKTAAPKGRVRA